MSGTLTGTAATEALRLYAGMGARELRFDASKVDRAVRSRKGRLSLSRALGACRSFWGPLTRQPRHSPSTLSRSGCRSSRRTTVGRSRCRSRAASAEPHPPAPAASPEPLSGSPAPGGGA